MPRQAYFISDTHFGHDKCWSTFKRDDGTPLRNFSSTEEMDQHMIDCWNNVVGDNDVVWHLGDVVINRKFMKTLYALKGKKRLIRGNHDIFPTTEYMQHFEEIYGSMKVGDFICSHIPIHEDSIARWSKGCVHGHLHSKRVPIMKRKADGTVEKTDKIDDRYICVSVENINYTPVPYEELEKYR